MLPKSIKVDPLILTLVKHFHKKDNLTPKCKFKVNGKIKYDLYLISHVYIPDAFTLQQGVIVH